MSFSFKTVNTFSLFFNQDFHSEIQNLNEFAIGVGDGSLNGPQAFEMAF